MKKKIILGTWALVMLSLVGTGVYFLLGGGNKSLSSAASKLKNTYTASSYTVVTPEGNTYDVINEKDTFYAALVSKGEADEAYTKYSFLMEDEDIIDASLYEYNNGIEESDYDEIVEDYKDLIYFNDPYVSRFFRIEPTTDDYYRPANGMHLTALKDLTKSYREGSSEFDFVETYTYDDESMELILYYEDYLDWCKANVEDFGRVGTLEDPDMILRYVITFEGDYVHQFKKFHHYSEGGSNSEIWTFTQVGEKNEDLSSYIADPKEYFQNVLAEINGKIIARIEKELKENPNYGYDSKGDIINEGDDFYSVDDFISTYTGDEIIAYLSGDESLPDKSKDWRIQYIDAYRNDEFYIPGNFGLVDIDKNGVPEMVYDTYARYSYECAYLDDKGKIQTFNLGDDITIYDNTVISYARTMYEYNDLEDYYYSRTYVNVYTFGQKGEEKVLNGYYDNILEVVDGADDREYKDNYTIDGTSVSESSFNSKINAYKDSTSEKEFDTEEYRESSFIRSILNYK